MKLVSGEGISCNAKDKKETLRKQHNDELIERFKTGDSLKAFDNQSSWYPPRPILTKDPDALTRLYGEYTVAPTDQKKDHQDP